MSGYSHDAKYEQELYEEMLEYIDEDHGTPPPKSEDPSIVEDYTSFFRSLGIEPLLVTIDKKGRVLATSDNIGKIIRVDLSDPR